MQDHTDLLRLMQQLKRIFKDLCMPVIHKYDLSRNELAILLFLDNNHAFDTARDLADFLFMSKSHISKSVDALMGRGLLEGRQDPHDRRVIHLSLRPEAAALLTDARLAHERFEALFLEGISPEDREAAERVLETVLKNAQNITAEGETALAGPHSRV